MSLTFSLTFVRRVEVFSRNITHNLAKMAADAEVYACLWRPSENGFEIASQLINPLEEGLRRLKANPEHFKQFDAPNGWGSYEDFVQFVEKCLEACKLHPDTNVWASR